MNRTDLIDRVDFGKLDAVFVVRRLLAHDEVLAELDLIALPILLKPRKSEGVRREALAIARQATLIYRDVRGSRPMWVGSDRDVVMLVHGLFATAEFDVTHTIFSEQLPYLPQVAGFTP